MGNQNGLDQFFTREETVLECVAATKSFLLAAGVDANFYIEPSAGAGAFLDALPGSAIGLDIAPQRADIREADFLRWLPDTLNPKVTVVIGNPPFGVRGRLAADFINHAAKMSDTVAFILPASFRKFRQQKMLVSDLRLQFVKELPFEWFTTPSGKTHRFNTVFQIWSRHELGPSLRALAPEPTSHSDFELRQYNNTPKAERYFDMPFDFAVPCQGWQNYDRRETDPMRCERNKQWMMVKAVSDQVHESLWNMNYGEIAERNGTSIPGFRKNDLVTEYEKMVAYV